MEINGRKDTSPEYFSHRPRLSLENGRWTAEPREAASGRAGAGGSEAGATGGHNYTLTQCLMCARIPSLKSPRLREMIRRAKGGAISLAAQTVSGATTCAILKRPTESPKISKDNIFLFRNTRIEANLLS